MFRRASPTPETCLLVPKHLIHCIMQSSIHYSTHTVFTRLNAAAFIEFLAFPMRPLFKGGVFSRAAFISKSYF